MLMKLPKNSQVMKNARNLFKAAKGLQVEVPENKAFVITEMVDSTLVYKMDANDCEYLGFSVKSLYFYLGMLNEEHPIIINTILCLRSWIEKTSDFKKENLEFFQFDGTGNLYGKLIIQDKSIGQMLLNNV